MLRNLHVKNLALIEEADVTFGEGFNILTGETGAGKSILLGSIQLALGGKVPKDFVRNEEKSASVELEFQVDNPKVLKKIEAFDVPMEEAGQVLLSRGITGGRSVARVNGETVSAGILKEIGSLLIDIHGQQEHQSLLHRRKHLEFLDNYARESLQKEKDILKETYRTYKAVEEELEQFSLSETEKNREMDLLAYEVQEIREASLRIGEEEELEQQYKKLNNARKILENISGIRELSGYEAGEGAGNTIGRALQLLQEVSEYDKELEEPLSELQTIEDLLGEFNREIAAYSESLDFEGADFSEVEERLDLIHKLENKYGNSIETVLDALEEREKRLAELSDYEELLNKKKKELEKQQEEVKKHSEKLTKLRKKAAAELEKAMIQALEELNFLEVAFEIRISPLEDYTANGRDEAAFYISTNPGESVKPMEQIASGGELSRIMLALKSVLAKKDTIDTLIFDEIDVGISGRTAQRVSEKMAALAKNHQILAITHLAQIAAMADEHFLIEKQVAGNETLTQIRPLEERETIEELARIQGGAEITDTIREGAAEMRRLAKDYKEILPV